MFKKKKRGFTLIEVILVIGLSAIVFAIALPNYIRYRQRQAAKSAASAFHADMQFAYTKATETENFVFVTFVDSGGRLIYKLIEDRPISGNPADLNPANNSTLATGFMKERNVFREFIGTEMVGVNTGDYLSFGYGGNVSRTAVDSGGSTRIVTTLPATSVPGTNIDYYTVGFQNNRARYDVRIFSTGKVEMVEIQ